MAFFGKKKEDGAEVSEVLDEEALNEEPASEESEEEEEFELLDESDFESLDDEIESDVIEEESVEEEVVAEDTAETEESEDAQSEEIAEEEAEESVEEEPVLTEETRKEEKKSFWSRVKQSLSKTKNALFSPIDDLLKSFVKVDEDLLEELEEVLICADIGVNATETIIDEWDNAHHFIKIYNTARTAMVLKWHK